jgi:hypothetical protein
MEKSVAWKFSPHRVEGNTVTNTKLKHIEENLTAVLDGDINLMQNSNNEKMNKSSGGTQSRPEWLKALYEITTEAPRDETNLTLRDGALWLHEEMVQWWSRQELNKRGQPPDNKSILEEAQAAVLERGESYGNVEDSWTTIAKGWNTLVGTPGWPIDAKQVGLMMIWLKIAREMHSSKRDNLVDIAGYAECLGRLNESR